MRLAIGCDDSLLGKPRTLKLFALQQGLQRDMLDMPTTFGIDDSDDMATAV